MKKPECRNRFNVVDCTFDREYFGENVKNDLFSGLVSRSLSLYRKDLLAHYGCVNAVEFSEDGSVFVSGSDDRRVLLWSIEEALRGSLKCKPIAMEAEHGSNVFCLVITNDKERIISGGNDYQVIVHDSKTAKPLDYFLHEKPIYGLSIQPGNPNVFATSSEDGKVRIFDSRASSQDVLASRRSPVHSVMFHPTDGTIVAMASAKDGTELLDLRVSQRSLRHYPNKRGAMSARFNSTGDKLLCLRRREPPIVYSTLTDEEIELHSDGYSNACTMKSCCFAGYKDEWAVSGSDDHNVYVWRVPNDFSSGNVEKAHLLLKGHRSVVNHVRFNDSACCLASSGVEKMIKIWSPVAFPGSRGGLDKEAEENFKPRKRFARDYSMIIAPTSNTRLSTEEDKKMLAFFDLLVERSTLMSSGDETDEEEEFDFDITSSRSSSDPESEGSEEESFHIETLSTPTSTSSPSSESSDSEDEPVAGPSGLNLANGSDQEQQKLELPAAFLAGRRSRAFSSSESDTEFLARSFPETEESEVRVPFRRVAKKVKRELRTRTTSSSSSSSYY